MTQRDGGMGQMPDASQYHELGFYGANGSPERRVKGAL